MWIQRYRISQPSLHRSTKKASVAQEHLEKVAELLSHIDPSLGGLAKTYVAPAAPDLSSREKRALDQLADFLHTKSGGTYDAQYVQNHFTVKVMPKAGGNKFDVNYYLDGKQRFRSMLQVGRALKIVDATSSKKRGSTGPKSEEAEKKKIRRDLDRLRKQQQRAQKALDDFVATQETDAMDDAKDSTTTPETCAGALKTDIGGFDGFPEHCTPDVISTWDFLCTFSRALSFTPVALDDFASALAYVPPSGHEGDDIAAAPVLVAEAHLALLKLLLQDKTSEDWWWSTLETDETEGHADVADEEDGRPPIKVDFAMLVAEREDPLITTSWLRSLEGLTKASKQSELRHGLRAVLKIATNKWVTGYLRVILGHRSNDGGSWIRRAIKWLVENVRRARPELADRTIPKDAIEAERSKAVQDVMQSMESLPSATPAVVDVDDPMDIDEEEEDSDDESDDDEADGNNGTAVNDATERPASSVPPKPLPTTVDLLLPPSKPEPNVDYLNAFTWSHMTGASVFRILHRKKRILNEVDDSIRAARALPPLTAHERREREALSVARFLSECVGKLGQEVAVEKAIEHLCNGGDYLELSPVQRLCVIRVLIECAYDTTRVYEVVDGNYKQRVNAMKSLENEQRKAKREAKEKAVSDEVAAREKLASDARQKFLDDQREEIRKLNHKSKEFADDVIDSLTDEDIIDFDEDIKADYDALPGPESFSKAEVSEMVVKMREADAFDAEALRVVTLDDLTKAESQKLEEMEGQFQALGGLDALTNDSSIDRETSRSLERLNRDIERAQTQAERLPELRSSALDTLNEAKEDGTIKVLRAAMNVAKKAKLYGPEEYVDGGVWCIPLVRDVALELENAKQNKKVADAQRDLIVKRNKCFIRSEPIGRDRFLNRFWALDNDESERVWVDSEYVVGEGPTQPRTNFVTLSRTKDDLELGAPEMQTDLDPTKSEAYERFCTLEHHSSGQVCGLASRRWGCHATEASQRRVIRTLNGNRLIEKELKSNLKESLEERMAAEKESAIADHEDDEHEGPEGSKPKKVASGDLLTGDEEALDVAKKEVVHDTLTLPLEPTALQVTSAIGKRIRVRMVLDPSKDPPLARYENGTVMAWANREVEKSDDEDEDDDASDAEAPGNGNTNREPEFEANWKVLTDRGHEVWITGVEVLEGLSRCEKRQSGRGAFENDSVFLAYRNHLGRFCGKAADAPYAASPLAFARMMVQQEADMYAKLKIRSYDNSWGGKSGARAMWINSMKDYAFDFQTAKQGLLTLENAFFDLTGEFTEYENVKSEEVDAKALLTDRASRFEIELESVEKNIPGLWNSPESRAVFLELVGNATTTGVLALAFDLLCRNTFKYLRFHKLLNVRTEEDRYQMPSTRTTRRQNAWQQANQELWY